MKQIYRNPFLIFLFIVFTVTNIFAQSPAFVSFPASQQESLTVCNSTAKVVVQIDFNTHAAGQNTTEAISHSEF